MAGMAIGSTKPCFTATPTKKGMALPYLFSEIRGKMTFFTEFHGFNSGVVFVIFSSQK